MSKHTAAARSPEPHAAPAVQLAHRGIGHEAV